MKGQPNGWPFAFKELWLAPTDTMPFPIDVEFRATWLNPLTLVRFTWIYGRKGLAKLWRSPGPNSRFLIYKRL